MAAKTILVTGATGKQGGATIAQLVDTNAKSPETRFNILALTRSPESGAAIKLAALKHVKVVKGDLKDRASLETIFENEHVHGVFLVTDPLSGDEVEQGSTIADVAAEHGVKQFVFSGVVQGVYGYDKPNPVPHFNTKLQIESHLLNLAATHPTFKTTFLRPPCFMDSFLSPGFLPLLLKYSNPDKPIAVIAVSDIGRDAALILADEAGKYDGKAIDLAGERLTLPGIVGRFGEVGVEVKGEVEREGGMLDLIKGLAATWNAVEWDTSSPEETRKLFPWVKDIPTWLKDEADLDTLRSAVA